MQIAEPALANSLAALERDLRVGVDLELMQDELKVRAFGEASGVHALPLWCDYA